MWMSVLIENNHTIDHLWMHLSNFRPQNFVKIVYVYLLVHCRTIWHCVCGNYTGIIVSHCHHLCHLRSFTSQFLCPRSVFSLPNVTLRFQFGFEVTYSGFEVTHSGFIDSDYSLQKRKSFLFAMSQMFLAQFHTMMFLYGEQHVWYPPCCSLFLHQLFS